MSEGLRWESAVEVSILEALVLGLLDSPTFDDDACSFCGFIVPALFGGEACSSRSFSLSPPLSAIVLPLFGGEACPSRGFFLSPPLPTLVSVIVLPLFGGEACPSRYFFLSPPLPTLMSSPLTPPLPTLVSPLFDG